MRSDHRLWIVVADGGRARVLTAGRSEGDYATLHTFDAADARHGGGHGTDSGSNAHEPGHRSFLHWLADWVDAAAGRDAFDRLAIVAPARALAELRAALGPSARSRLVGVLAKDLVKIPDHEIPPHLTWETLQGETP
jgi:protein required for attachment to host cells